MATRAGLGPWHQMGSGYSGMAYLLTSTVGLCQVFGVLLTREPASLNRAHAGCIAVTCFHWALGALSVFSSRSVLDNDAAQTSLAVCICCEGAFPLCSKSWLVRMTQPFCQCCYYCCYCCYIWLCVSMPVRDASSEEFSHHNKHSHMTTAFTDSPFGMRQHQVWSLPSE